MVQIGILNTDVKSVDVIIEILPDREVAGDTVTGGSTHVRPNQSCALLVVSGLAILEE